MNDVELVKVTLPAHARRALRVAERVWAWWASLDSMVPGPLVRIEEVKRGTFDFIFEVQYWVQDCWQIALECVTVAMEETVHDCEKNGSGGNVFFDSMDRKTWKAGRIEIEWQARTHEWPDDAKPEREVWATDEQMIALAIKARLDPNDLMVSNRRGHWGRLHAGCHEAKAGTFGRNAPQIPEEQARASTAPARCNLPKPGDPKEAELTG